MVHIHGSGPDSRGWGQTFDDLAVDHHVIAYDRRGYGESLDQPLTDWHGHGEDAAELLRVLDAAPASVVGWSAGGLAALDLAVNHPEHVKALVLAETGLYGKRKLTLSLRRGIRACADSAGTRQRPRGIGDVPPLGDG